MDNSNNSDNWLTGVDINQADEDDQAPVTDQFPTINLPPAWAPIVPPPPPNPTFLPTPSILAQQPQTEALEHRIEDLFREAERAQNDRDQRLHAVLELQESRRMSEFGYLNSKLRSLDNSINEITDDIASLKRRSSYLEDQADDILADNREAKRRTIDNHNAVQDVLKDFSRQSGERHREIEQRLTEMEENSRKTERKVEKLGKSMKDAGSELQKLSDVVEKNGSAGDRSCLARNLVCLHHVVSSDSVPPCSCKESDGEDSEDSESQQTDTSVSTRAKTDPSYTDRSGRSLGGKNRRKTRLGQ